MRYRNPTRLVLLSLVSIVFAALLYSSVTSQSRNKNQNQNSSEDVVKIDADLVKIDALVMQKNTARIVRNRLLGLTQ